MKKYRKVLGLAIVLVALAVAINALAFKSASVTNSASFTVSATNAAALAIEAGGTPGTGFSTAGITDGSLTLTINDKMQPNSTYKFSEVFKVTHKATSTNSITGVGYTVSVPAGFQASDIKLYETGGSTELSNKTLTSGAPSVTLDLEIHVPAGVTIDTVTPANNVKSFNIVITGNQ